MRNLFLIPASISLLALGACNIFNPDGGDSPAENFVAAESYTTANGNLYRTEAESYCEGNTLEQDPYMIREAYTLSGNTLNEQESDTLEDGGVVLETLTLKRSGSGTDLQGGTWNSRSLAYLVASGSEGQGAALDADDKKEFATDSLLNTYALPESEVFTADSVYTYANVQAARFFLAVWNSGDTADDSISVSYVSQYVLRFKGLRTGEVLTETYSGDLNEITYSSNVPADTTLHLYNSPPSCPQPDLSWVESFIEANQKNSAEDKKAAGVSRGTSSHGTARYRPFLPGLLSGSVLKPSR